MLMFLNVLLHVVFSSEFKLTILNTLRMHNPGGLNDKKDFVYRGTMPRRISKL